MVSLVILVTAVVGIAYFTSESKQIPLMTQTPAEALMEEDFGLFAKTLETALQQKLYSGNNDGVTETITALENYADTSGREFTADCSETNNGTHFFLDCVLTLNAGEYEQTKIINYTYTIPYQITLYSDSNYAIETNKFSRGDTVYYKVTSTNTMVNFTVYDSLSVNQYSENKTFSDYQTLGSFSIGSSDEKGEWTIKLNDSTQKTFFVDYTVIKLVAYDNQSNPREEFTIGEIVNYTVFLEDYTGTPFNANVSIIKTNENGKPVNSIRGLSTSGMFNESFTVVGPSGDFVLTATEHNNYYSNSVTITVLASEYPTFVELLVPFLSWDNPFADAFAGACGYDNWYGETNTTYLTIPFSVENGTSNAVLRVDNETEVITTPHVYADKLHFIASRCDSC